MQTTQEVRDAMQQVHDLSSDEEAGPSNKVSYNNSFILHASNSK
jgi:hypothetical protein